MILYRPMPEPREGDSTHDGPSRRTPPVPVGDGDLCGLVRSIVDASPGRGEGGYVEPSPGEAAAFGALVRAMGGAYLRGARRLAGVLGYALTLHDDGVTGRRLLVAREAAGRGWGAVVVDPEGDDVLVEVAHPGSDLKTPEVGVAVFREARARALLVAGAHRYAWRDARCDAARAPGTPFDLAHRALLPARCVVQPHGFQRAQSDYPDVVLSSGASPPPPALVSIRESLEEAGFEAGLWEGGERYRGLAATRNRQGAPVREAGGLFVHLELSRKLRENRDERRRLAAALAQAIGRRSAARRTARGRC